MKLETISRRPRYMNAYELIMKIQQKMQKDPSFSQKLNNLVKDLNNTPGLQQEIMKIAQMDNEKKRQNALDKLPEKVKRSVVEIINIING